MTIRIPGIDPPPVDPSRLLAELDDCMRTMPIAAQFTHQADDAFAWFGRVSAVLHEWDDIQTLSLSTIGTNLRDPRFRTFGYQELVTLIHRARHSLRMRTTGPLSVPMQEGQVFQYFDEVRKLIEEARDDVLFVDPYLDASFVARYLPHVASGVTVRLLAYKKVAALLAAVEAFTAQHSTQIEVRSSGDFHDRFVFIDKRACYQSGASFKDGARLAPTTVTQITDAFPTMLQTYETLWTAAKRP